MQQRMDGKTVLITGGFFIERRQARATRGARDRAAQDHLWDLSESLTRLRGTGITAAS